MAEAHAPAALVTLLQQRLGLSPEAVAQVLAAFRPRQLRPREHWLHPADVATAKGWIAKGAVRVYFTDANGKDNILFFKLEGDWIGDVASYHSGQPSRIAIQALEPTEVWSIAKADFERLQTQYSQLQHWYEVNAVQMYTTLFNRLYEAKIRTPEERYQHLLRTAPQYLQRLPAKDIAAYLEIEPQSYSRIRRRHRAADKGQR